MKRFVVLAFVAAALGFAGCVPPPRVSPEEQVKINVDLPTEHFVLANGLRVVLHYQPEATSAFVTVRYHVGSKDDPVGRAGFAHLFEHLMFRSGKHLGGKSYDQWIDEVGGASNAGTDLDTTDYYEQIPIEAVPRALWLEADRMAHPLDGLDDATFQVERRVVQNELRERHSNAPLGSVRAVAHEEVFGDAHPYNTLPSGRMAEIGAITLAEARAFARLYYGPNNATLVICSPLAREVVRAHVKTFFATIPPGLPVPTRAIAPARIEGNRVVEMVADVDPAAVALAWAAPHVHGDGSLELRLAEWWLRGVLSHELVFESKVAEAVEVDYEAGMLGGLFLVTVRPAKKKSISAVVSAVDDVIADASHMGGRSHPENFADYRTRFMIDTIRKLETGAGRADRILHDIEFHESTNATQGDLQRWQSISAAAVGNAVDQVLVRGHRVELRIAAKRGAPPAGERASP